MAAERKKACCLVSEILEEAGLDRSHVRAIRRQVLQGLMLFCQWQLERMDRTAAPSGRSRGRKVQVE
jgi:hypothetical protein